MGANGRIAITHDARTRYKPNEVLAVRNHRVSLLVVVGKAPFPELAKNFVTTMPRIAAFVARHRPPYIAKVYRPSPAGIGRQPGAPGSVSLWHAP